MHRVLITLNFFFHSILLCAQAHIMIRGTDDKQTIQHQARYYAEQFAFDSTVHLLIVFTDELPRRINGHMLFSEVFGNKQIHIRINHKVKGINLHLTLAHEMVHAWQFVSGELQYVDKNYYIWQGQAHKNIKHIPYADRAWEKEAHKMAYLMYHQYKKLDSLYTLRDQNRNTSKYRF